MLPRLQRRVLEQVTTAATRIDFGIFLKATEELVGRVQLSGIAPAPFESAYLGYSVSERHNGRGYATEAVAAMLAVAWADPVVEAVLASTAPSNLASQRVLEKAGFQLVDRAGGQDGELRYRVPRPGGPGGRL